MLISNWLTGLFFAALTSVSLLGWGGWLTRRCRLPLSIAAVAGLGIALSVMSALGALPHGYTPLVQGLVLVWGLGLFFRERERWRVLAGTLPWRPSADSLFFIFPLLYFLARLFSGGVPQQHSDALYYHLAAPKHWAQLGRIILVDTHPTFAQTGIWENIYGVPMLFLGTKGLFPLITTQLYSQWMHMLWGQVGCMLMGAALIGRLAPASLARPGLRIFLAWLACSFASVEWLGCLAKNDFILTLFAMGALAAAIEGRPGWAGFLAACSFSTKSLGIVAVAGTPIAVTITVLCTRLPWPARWRRLGKAALAYGACAVLGALPFTGRNWLWTGNPLFPYLDEVIGPGWLTTFWIGHLHAGGGGFQLNSVMPLWVWNSIYLRTMPKIILVAGGTLLLLHTVLRRLGVMPMAPLPRVTWMTALGGGLTQLILVMLMMRPVSDGRYGISAGIICLTMAAAGLAGFLATLKGPLRALSIIALLPLGAMVNIPVDNFWKIPRDYWFAPSVKYLDQFHWTYDSKKWLNEHTGPRETLLFTSDKINFYLDRDFETMPEMRRWELRLEKCRELNCVLQAVRENGYRWIHFNIESIYPPYIEPYWNELTQRKDEAVFSSSTSLIFEANK